MTFAYAVREGGTIDVVIRSSQFHIFTNDIPCANHSCYVIDVIIDRIHTYIRQHVLFTVVVVVAVVFVNVIVGVL